MKEHHIVVPKTARYFTLGATGRKIREIWFVCHGYGQLARYFLRNFRVLNNRERLIVAPEALSRFYLRGTGGRVGASWMTKEDRLNEMDDYINYMDALFRRLAKGCDPENIRIIVLGFSQGTATACRWVSRTRPAIHRLILWAGLMPPELDLAADQKLFSRIQLTFVLGTEDEYARPELIDQQQQVLQKHNIPYQWIRFRGGHRLDEDTLKYLAAVNLPPME